MQQLSGKEARLKTHVEKLIALPPDFSFPAASAQALLVTDATPVIKARGVTRVSDPRRQEVLGLQEAVEGRAGIQTGTAAVVALDQIDLGVARRKFRR